MAVEGPIAVFDERLGIRREVLEVCLKDIRRRHFVFRRFDIEKCAMWRTRKGALMFGRYFGHHPAAIVGGLQGVGLFGTIQAAHADGHCSPTLLVVASVPRDEALVGSFAEIQLVKGCENVAFALDFQLLGKCRGRQCLGCVLNVDGRFLSVGQGNHHRLLCAFLGFVVANDRQGRLIVEITVTESIAVEGGSGRIALLYPILIRVEFQMDGHFLKGGEHLLDVSFHGCAERF